eukprot:7090395-Prymnesium_polylepis.3
MSGGATAAAVAQARRNGDDNTAETHTPCAPRKSRSTESASLASWRSSSSKLSRSAAFVSFGPCLMTRSRRGRVTARVGKSRRSRLSANAAGAGKS